VLGGDYFSAYVLHMIIRVVEMSVVGAVLDGAGLDGWGSWNGGISGWGIWGKNSWGGGIWGEGSSVVSSSGG